jgi:hypothetical protein
MYLVRHQVQGNYDTYIPPKKDSKGNWIPFTSDPFHKEEILRSYAVTLTFEVSMSPEELDWFDKVDIHKPMILEVMKPKRK